MEIIGCKELLQRQEEKIKDLQREVSELKRGLEWVQIVARGMVPSELCDQCKQRRG